MKDVLAIYKSELQKAGLKVTKSRISVFSILQENKSLFLSPDEIFEKILTSSLDKCDKTSVYRVLSTLESIDLVKTSHFQGESSKYQIHLHNDSCNHAAKDHEHYFKCVDCKTISPIGACFSGPIIKELSKTGHKTISHHFEVSGLCPQCNQE